MRAEQSRAEQSRAEQSRAEQSRAEQGYVFCNVRFVPDGKYLPEIWLEKYGFCSVWILFAQKRSPASSA